MTFEYADRQHAPPPPKPDDSDWLVSAAHFVWQVVVGIGVPVGVGVAVGLSISVILGFLFGLLTAVLLFTTARAAQLARRRRALIVLSHVDTAVRMNLPLPSTLRRFRDAEPRKVARLLDRVAKNLESGAWVSDSMRQARVDLPARVLDRLSAAEHAGRLSANIGEVLSDERGRRARDPGRGPFLRV
ncbi:MAG: type II secretion system F family protein [Anaerolineae bacterium]|nr:type II secretion system F family protein [Phycisphaerae bacterium]